MLQSDVRLRTPSDQMPLPDGTLYVVSFVQSEGEVVAAPLVTGQTIAAANANCTTLPMQIKHVALSVQIYLPLLVQED